MIAIAGSQAKCTKLREMGCHTVLNYKDANFKSEFRKIGLLDVFFDNGMSVQKKRGSTLMCQSVDRSLTWHCGSCSHTRGWCYVALLLITSELRLPHCI